MEAFLILIILWIIYFTIHSVFASKAIKDLFNRHFPRLKRYYRIIYVSFASLGLPPIFMYQSTLPQLNFYRPDTLVIFLGLSLASIGLIIIKESFAYYDTKEFLGLRQLKDNFREQDFVRQGILRRVRHPLYSGTILILTGYLIVTPTIINLITVTCMTLYFIIGSRFEEKRMIKSFGEEYIRYKQEVPPFIPHIATILKHLKKAKKS
jgi:protein-S-isoprenylcysteine O-methyltransferase Ste14